MENFHRNGFKNMDLVRASVTEELTMSLVDVQNNINLGKPQHGVFFERIYL